MNNSLQEQNRNKITAITLLKHLELKRSTTRRTEGDAAYYQHLKDLSTVKHIKDLLSSLDSDEDDDDEERASWASTSRTIKPPPNSNRDLRKRVATLESNLLLAAPTKKSQSIALPTLDILRPAPPILIPPPIPILDTKAEKKDDFGGEEGLDKEGDEDGFGKELLAEAASTFPIIAASTSPTKSPPLSPPTSTGLLPLDSPTSSRSALLSLPSSASTLRSRPSATHSPSSNDATSSNNLLDHHLSLQTSLLTSLTSMSTQLKTNSLVFSSSLQKDKEVLEEAEKKLEKNFGGMKDQSGRLRGYGKRQKGGTCWIILGVAVVGVAWTGVFLLIKVT